MEDTAESAFVRRWAKKESLLLLSKYDQEEKKNIDNHDHRQVNFVKTKL